MRNVSCIQRIFASAIAGIGLALWLSSPARSLTAIEADKTSALLVELASEMGEFAYDEEEAGRIFEEDETMNRRIAAAGFSREQWQVSVDAAFRGFLATIPSSVFSARIAEIFARLDASSSLSDAQKAEVRAITREKMAEIQLMRAEGAAYADAVAPYADRLEAAFRTGLGTED